MLSAIDTNVILTLDPDRYRQDFPKLTLVTSTRAVRPNQLELDS